MPMKMVPGFDRAQSVRAVRPYLLSAGGVGIAALSGFALTALVRLPNVSMIFLLAVLFSAVRFGIWPALFASGLSFLAYNFLFIEPVYTFSVTQPHELLALFVLLAVATLTSAIAGRARNEERRALERAKASRRLYEFARRLSGLADPNSVLEGAAIQAHSDLHRPSIILLPDRGTLSVFAAWPPEDELDSDALEAATAAFRADEATGAGTAHYLDVPWLFLPLRTPENPVGVIGVSCAASEPAIDPESRTFFQTLAELTATALERARLAHEIGRARSDAETERVRNTLLASISHDFRTPLASVLGAATSLIDYGRRLPEEARRDLLGQIKDEAENLDGMVRNLLAIMRVEAGALEVRRDWVDIRELFDHAVAAAKRRGATQRFAVTVDGGLPFLAADPVLLGQLLANLVSNAVRYAGPRAHIALKAQRENGKMVLSVADDGPGIDPAVLPHIFDKFVRAPTSGDAGEGTGLGLAIAKGIVEAHGGTVNIESPLREGRGTRVVIRLPIEEDDS